MQISLAHLSDIHLGPLPQGAVWKDFKLKRVVGGLSWRLRRRHLHDVKIADLMAADIKAAKPDHVALTGDLVNIAAHEEFKAAGQWLRNFGDPSWINLVPGNHDAYVRVSWEHGLQHVGPYMTGSLAIENQATSFHNAAGFPYVRFKGSLALVALTSAEPQALHRAGGRLGERQLQLLEKLLQDLKRKGCYRAVLIHHPPLPGLAKPRKALRDAAALREILVKEGAEIVLHGHNHREMLHMLDTKDGPIPIVGVPSASFNGLSGHDPAAWNLYRIGRSEGKWRTDVTVRSFDAKTASFQTLKQFTLPP